VSGTVQIFFCRDELSFDVFPPWKLLVLPTFWPSKSAPLLTFLFSFCSRCCGFSFRLRGWIHRSPSDMDGVALGQPSTDGCPMIRSRVVVFHCFSPAPYLCTASPSLLWSPIFLGSLIDLGGIRFAYWFPSWSFIVGRGWACPSIYDLIFFPLFLLFLYFFFARFMQKNSPNQIWVSKLTFSSATPPKN